MLESVWRKSNPPTLLWEYELVQLQWRTEVPLKLKIELPYDKTIPLPDINSEKMKALIQDTCIPVFIATLFIITKPWKQPECPSVVEWIKEMCYEYTGEYYSTVQRMKYCHLQQH